MDKISNILLLRSTRVKFKISAIYVKIVKSTGREREREIQDYMLQEVYGRYSSLARGT